MDNLRMSVGKLRDANNSEKFCVSSQLLGLSRTTYLPLPLSIITGGHNSSILLLNFISRGRT